MIDDLLREELAAVAERVTPAPDPLGRLRQRQRRRRTQRRAGLATALVVVLAVAGVALLRPRDAVGPPANAAGWAELTLTAPTRGNLPASFTGNLLEALRERVATGAVPGELTTLAGVPLRDRTMRLLFAADVGAYRVSAVAFSERNRPADTATVLWLRANSGADARDLAGATAYTVAALKPFTTVELAVGTGPPIAVGLAPSGCDVATAPMPALTDWQVEPTRSYVARAPDQRRAEWWRVTCGGVIHYEAPAPAILDPTNPDTVQFSAVDLAEAVQGARRAVTADQIVTEMGSLTELGYQLRHKPALVWGGPVADLPSGDGLVVVVSAPAVSGGWIGLITVPAAQGARLGAMFGTPTDPRDPTTLLAVRLPGEAGGHVLAIVPAGATAVRLVDHGRAGPPEPTVEGAAVLAGDGESVEALGPSGEVVARTLTVGVGVTLPHTEDWIN